MQTLPVVEHETKPTIERSVIWLHGLGADGYDFLPIVENLDLGTLPGIRFIFPHAPMRAISINGGMGMRAWYDIRQMDLIREEDEAGIRTSEEQIRALIINENERGISSQHIVLAGFSQGAAMTLHTGLRYQDKLAGLIALSGYLPLSDKLLDEATEANKTTNLFMAHGTQDTIVPIQRGLSSNEQLNVAGYPIEWKTYPMAHSVHPQEIEDISRFLQRILM